MKFTKEHEWIEAEGDTAKIGLSDFAQQALGDIVFVDLPKIGVKLVAGKSFGSVESVKAVSDLYAPVSGTVLEINDELEDAPELLNEKPYESWLLKIEMENPAELDLLMDEARYVEYCEQEA